MPLPTQDYAQILTTKENHEKSKSAATAGIRMNALLRTYKKTIASVVIGVLGWSSAVTVSDASDITASEWVGLVTVLATAVGVYQLANEPLEPGQ